MNCMALKLFGSFVKELEPSPSIPTRSESRLFKAFQCFSSLLTLLWRSLGPSKPRGCAAKPTSRRSDSAAPLPTPRALKAPARQAARPRNAPPPRRSARARLRAPAPRPFARRARPSGLSTIGKTWQKAPPFLPHRASARAPGAPSRGSAPKHLGISARQSWRSLQSLVLHVGSGTGALHHKQLMLQRLQPGGVEVLRRRAGAWRLPQRASFAYSGPLFSFQWYQFKVRAQNIDVS